MGGLQPDQKNRNGMAPISVLRISRGHREPPVLVEYRSQASTATRIGERGHREALYM